MHIFPLCFCIHVFVFMHALLIFLTQRDILLRSGHRGSIIKVAHPATISSSSAYTFWCPSANKIKLIYRICFLQAGPAQTRGCSGRWPTAAHVSQMHMISLHIQVPFSAASFPTGVGGHSSLAQSAWPSASPEVTSCGSPAHLAPALLRPYVPEPWCKKRMEDKRLFRPPETPGPWVTCTKNNLCLHE